MNSSIAGKVGYLLMFAGAMQSFEYIISLRDNKNFILYLVVGIVLLATGYNFLVRDPYMKQLGWKLLWFQPPDSGWSRFGVGLYISGVLLLITAETIVSSEYANSVPWFNVSIGIIAIILGTVLFLRGGAGQTKNPNNP